MKPTLISGKSANKSIEPMHLFEVDFYLSGASQNQKLQTFFKLNLAELS